LNPSNNNNKDIIIKSQECDTLESLEKPPYKLTSDWSPDRLIVRKIIAPEIPEEFIAEQADRWLAYRLAEGRENQSRTHVAWHETFKSHVMQNWGYHKKKHHIKTPEHKRQGFDTPEAQARAQGVAADRQLLARLQVNGEKLRGQGIEPPPIPEYLVKYLEPEGVSA